MAVIISESDGGSGFWHEWDTLVYASGTFIKRETFAHQIELEIDVDNSYILNHGWITKATNSRFQRKWC